MTPPAHAGKPMPPHFGNAPAPLQMPVALAHVPFPPPQFAAFAMHRPVPWLQQPAVLIFFAVLMLVLAASMFGAWEFTVPQFVANRAMGRAGLAGALTMGLFVGIVAAPCVGPAVVALVGLVAAIGKPLIGLAMFAALALGLGFPYLVMLNALPKPGEWMVTIAKKAAAEASLTELREEWMRLARKAGCFRE